MATATPDADREEREDRPAGGEREGAAKAVARGSGDGADEEGSGLDTADGSLAALLERIAHAPAETLAFDLSEGTLIGDTYRITRRIGAGAMGVVYLARDLELDRDVAIKVHRASAGVERLQREALAMARLAHPNVVTVHRVDRIGGRLYVAMEHIPGGATLNDWLHAAQRSQRQILDLLLAAGEGLAAAHDAGLVHRDFKPENILVGPDGRPRVGDFGLVYASGDADGTRGAGRSSAGRAPGGGASGRAPTARTIEAVGGAVGSVDFADAAEEPTCPAVDPVTWSPGLTVSGTVLGTPAYMAPEQYGERPVDARADQFAFCVVLYEALCGRRPWPGTSPLELREQIGVDPAAPPAGTMPRWVWQVVRRGLANDPAQRYPDMRAMLAALRSPPRPRARIVVAAAAGVLAIGTAAALAWSGRGATSRAAGPCDEMAITARQIWNPDQRRLVTAVLSAADPGKGPAVADRLIAALDRWEVGWAAAVEACRAAPVTPFGVERPDESAPLRARCLGSSLAQARALAFRGKISRDPGALGRLAADIDSLGSAADCLDQSGMLRVAQSVRDADGAAMTAEGGFWYGDFGRHVFRRVGGEIWGVYDHDDGTLRGTMADGSMVGWWCETPSRRPDKDAGALLLTLIPGPAATAIATTGTTIDGLWSYGTRKTWYADWDLAWVPEPPPPSLLARFDDPGQFCPPPPPPPH